MRSRDAKADGLGLTGLDPLFSSTCWSLAAYRAKPAGVWGRESRYLNSMKIQVCWYDSHFYLSFTFSCTKSTNFSALGLGI